MRQDKQGVKRCLKASRRQRREVKVDGRRRVWRAKTKTAIGSILSSFTIPLKERSNKLSVYVSFYRINNKDRRGGDGDDDSSLTSR